MAYSSNEAYDFELFENREGSAVRKKQEFKAPKIKQKAEVIDFPKTKEKTHNFAKIMKRVSAVSCVLIIFSLIAGLLYSRAYLDELTDTFNTAQTSLSEQQSINVQLSNKLAEKYTTQYIETYAGSHLEMRKANKSQISYVSVSKGDCGTVVQKSEGSNIFTKIFNSIGDIIS